MGSVQERLENRIIESDYSQGSILTPMQTPYKHELCSYGYPLHARTIVMLVRGCMIKCPQNSSYTGTYKNDYSSNELTISTLYVDV